MLTNDLTTRAHSDQLIISADEWEELQDLQAAVILAETDEVWEEYAGKTFDRIVELAESRGLNVDQYLETVAQRRDQLMEDLFTARNPEFFDNMK